MSLSTHVLDTTRGVPAVGIPVRLERRDPGDQDSWTVVATGHTDETGRLRDWVPPHEWGAGVWRLVFDVWGYFDGGFFPEVVVIFTVTAPDQHYHVPLLLSPFGYTTYRGS